MLAKHLVPLRLHPQLLQLNTCPAGDSGSGREVAPRWPRDAAEGIVARSGSLGTRQLAEGKAYGGGSGFIKGGLPRDAVQAGVWGAGSPFGEEGGAV